MDFRKVTLDTTDWNILKELQKNARASFTDIGQKVGLSGPAVRDRIKDMEEFGIIDGYRAVLNYSMLGRGIRAIIELRAKMGHDDGNLDAKTLELCASTPEIIRYWNVTGEVSYIMEAVLTSTRELERLITKFSSLGYFTTTYLVLDVASEKSFESGTQ